MHAGFQAPAPGLYSTAARGKVWSVLKKLKVAVLFGGASSEHEVSRMSATSVLNNLDTEKYDVLPVGITKDGRWYLYSGPVEDLCSGAWERHSGNVPAAICPGSGLAGLVAFENGVCRSLPVDVVFPVAARQKRRGRHDTGPAGAGRPALCGLRRAGQRGVHG